MAQHAKPDERDRLARAFLAGYSGIDPGPLEGAERRLIRFARDAERVGLDEAKVIYRRAVNQVTEEQ